MYHIFIHSSVNGHLGYFCVLAIVNIAVMNIGVRVSFGYNKAAYCHPAYLTAMQNTSCEMPDWMNSQAGIRIARRNPNNLRYADDITVNAACERN